MNSNTTALLALLAGGVVLGGLAVVVVKVASEPHTSHAAHPTRRSERKAARRHRQVTRSRIQTRLERSYP